MALDSVHLENSTLTPTRHSEGGLQLPRRFFEQMIQSCIVMGRVMVERDQLLCAYNSGEFEGMSISAVAPPDTASVLVLRVLSVVDQEIGPGGKVIPGDPVLARPTTIMKSKRRLVIRQVSDHALVGLNPIADSRPGVADQRRIHQEWTDLKGSSRHLMAGEPGQVSKVHWKQRWG